MNAPIDDVAFLADLPDETRARLRASARRVALRAGDLVFEAGGTAQAFLIVVEGRVRVHLTAENGREITLYKVDAGDSCVLTTSCLLDAEAYGAEAVCESDVVAIAIPRGAFRELMDTSSGFRDAVLRAYAARVADLIMTIEETRFRRVDARLARLVLDRTATGPLRATHQDLAAELGTAREVVSRMLKRFEGEGTVTLARGSIEVRDRARLARDADGA